MNGEPGVDQPFGVDRPKIQKFDVTHHHWNVAGLAQGLRIIGYGIAIVGVAVFLSVAMIVTYLNAQV